MGGCGSSPEDKAAKRIDQGLKKDMNEETRVIKLLLLGAGDSGKSTILKQMKIIAGAGYSEDERRGFISVVNRNILENMRRLVEACSKLEITIDADLKPLVATVFDASSQDTKPLSPMAPDLTKAIKQLWQSDPIRQAHHRRVEFQMDESASYFFEDIQRIGDPQYLPVEQDILRTRVRTTGITNYDFIFKNQKFQMFDVGGQRNERRKWIHCFDGVHAVLFIVALSEYDQRLFEDDSTNRMLEALTLFAEICNSQFFVRSGMILFLNKSDLFKTKILEKNITEAFPEYMGPQTFDDALEYITQRFKSTNKSDKEVYVHVTNATDTSNIAYVFAAVRDTMLKNNLEKSGFM